MIRIEPSRLTRCKSHFVQTSSGFVGRASNTAPRLYVRRRRRKRDGWRGSFTFSPLLFSAAAKKKQEGRESNERGLSPRNTAKLCIRSKERNLRHFASFFFAGYISPLFLTFTLAYTHRAAPRRSLILSHVPFDNLSRFFFSSTVVPSFKDYPG